MTDVRILPPELPGDRPLDESGMPEGVAPIDGLEISPRDTARSLQTSDDTGFILLDCREPFEHDAVHVEGSVLIPMGDVPSRLQELDLDDDTPVAVICHSGRRSLAVTQFLHQQGVAGARSVAGGIDLWSRAVDPALPRYGK